MSGLNKAMIIGRLGKDPEIRYTTGGMAIANFSIATSEEWKDKESNEKKERTEWHRIVAFGKLGEICGEYLSKGKQIYVEGRIQTRSWDDKEGNRKYTTEIVATDVQFLDRKDSGDSSKKARYHDDDAIARDIPGPIHNDAKDDDIPF
ncbi:MAG: single-stranded DNA-binding protein [Desulfobacteraceae bacterium]|nr:MAG: single-stranded DNA-binding protein [Desulfobacteraceae bacterium]